MLKGFCHLPEVVTVPIYGLGPSLHDSSSCLSSGRFAADLTRKGLRLMGLFDDTKKINTKKITDVNLLNSLPPPQDPSSPQLL